MAAKPEITMQQVRNAIVSLGFSGAEISNVQLYEIFDYQDESDKVRLRRRLQDMVKSGELLRVREGIFKYNSKFNLSASRLHSAMWRYVRMQKPGWSLTDMSLCTRASYTHASKYCTWLQEEGYIEVMGKKGLVKLYRATTKATSSPETPLPPKKVHDPFSKEKAAATAIVRAMLCSDLNSKKTATAILEACSIIQQRFSFDTENENQTGGYDV